MEDLVWTHAHPYCHPYRLLSARTTSCPPNLAHLHMIQPQTHSQTTVRSSHRPGTHPPEQTSPFSPTYPQDDPLRSGIGVAPTPRTFTAVGTEYGDGETGFGALPPPPCPTDSRVLPYVCLASPGVHVSRHGLPRLWPWHGEAVSPDTGHGGFFQVNLVHRLVDFQLP